LNVSQNSFKLLKAKGNIVLNTFEYRESSYLEFSDLLDAEAGYFELIELKNNGNSDYKLSDIFSKAELGKEGARIGESIELEFVYRSKTKKMDISQSIYLPLMGWSLKFFQISTTQTIC
jgi:hypothetical protein